MVLLVIKQTIYIDTFSDISNPEGHLNRCIGSKVTAILLNGWNLPTGGVASGRVCPAACAAGLFIYNDPTAKEVNSQRATIIHIWELVDFFF